MPRIIRGRCGGREGCADVRGGMLVFFAA